MGPLCWWRLPGTIGFVAFTSVSCASPEVGPLPEPPNTIALVKTVLGQAPFGIALDDWLVAHPSAACRRHRDRWAEMTRPEPPFDWCAVCIEQQGFLTTESGFYTLRDDVPIACRLEHIRAYETGPLATVRRIHNDTVELITRRRGMGLRPILTRHTYSPYGAYEESVGDTLEDFGTGAWSDIYQWKPGAEDAYAYLYEDVGRRFPASAAVSIADPQLKERLLEEIRRHYKPEDWTKGLAETLRETAPSVSAQLSKSKSPGSNLRLAILDAMARVRTAPEDGKPALLFAADRLAVAYVETLPRRFDARSPILRPLTRAGLGFRNIDFTGVLRTTPVLLRTLVERYPETRWGDRASIALLERWGDCESIELDDPFRRMIDDGTRWLSDHPQSPNRVQVMFDVAESYETWWSLANAVADSLVKREDYLDGSEAARQHAIEWYQRAEKALKPESDGAFAARRKIARLTLKLDTGQRAYSCLGGG